MGLDTTRRPPRFSGLLNSLASRAPSASACAYPLSVKSGSAEGFCPGGSCLFALCAWRTRTSLTAVLWLSERPQLVLAPCLLPDDPRMVGIAAAFGSSVHDRGVAVRVAVLDDGRGWPPGVAARDGDGGRLPIMPVAFHVVGGGAPRAVNGGAPRAACGVGDPRGVSVFGDTDGKPRRGTCCPASAPFANLWVCRVKAAWVPQEKPQTQMIIAWLHAWTHVGSLGPRMP
mmetsp:Transcript_60481/g.170399  ORF Transcript_60481/g.170399 Transcript_60481/m.170399 type:complete len:229 (+) Transcript_60481:689-1375(+)